LAFGNRLYPSGSESAKYIFCAVEVTGKPSPLWSENLNLQILQCEVAHRGPDQVLQKIYFLPNVRAE
jgi:hypothetical protein